MDARRQPKKSDGAAGDTGVAPRLIVGIGASAGGLEALTQLLQALPRDTGLAVVVVQHLDPDHESALTQLLAKAAEVPVLEAKNDRMLAPDHVYVIPPNANLRIARGVLKVEPREVTRGASRSIDLFLESLAEDQRERAIGVILSGAASDGTLGLEAIKGEGGITFAQDKTARYDSMPRSAIATGCVDFVLPPEGIARELARIAEHPFIARQLAMAAEPGGAQEGAADLGSARDDDAAVVDVSCGDDLKKILLLLRSHSGVDFSLYKPATIRRRIARRMVLNKLRGLEAYAKFLRGNQPELGALYADVLIGVTGFFRNPEAFEALKREVFPGLVAARREDALRVWVLGCSTGQEAYSLAMVLTEFLDRVPRAPKLQIFATDLSEAMLGRARAASTTRASSRTSRRSGCGAFSPRRTAATASASRCANRSFSRGRISSAIRHSRAWTSSAAVICSSTSIRASRSGSCPCSTMR